MGKFWDELKNAVRDQTVGAMKHGASTSYSHNKAAMESARAEREKRERRGNHKGGFGASEHGFIGEHAVTFALGWGTKDGETLLADGHIDDRTFRQSSNHDHYGRGQGPNNNGTLRRKYTGPDA